MEKTLFDKDGPYYINNTGKQENATNSNYRKELEQRTGAGPPPPSRGCLRLNKLGTLVHSC